MTNSSDPDFEIKTLDCKAEDLNMDNFDIFEYSVGQQTKQFILFIRGNYLALAVHFNDGKVKFYDPIMREDLLCIDSDTLIFEKIILNNNDPLNISKLNTTRIGKSEDYSYSKQSQLSLRIFNKCCKLIWFLMTRNINKSLLKI